MTGLDINRGRGFLTTASLDENFFVIDLEDPESASILHSAAGGTGPTDLGAYRHTFEAYPARQIIDTFSALDSQIDLGEDGIHLSQAGHDLRAELVVQKLTLGQ